MDYMDFDIPEWEYFGFISENDYLDYCNWIVDYEVCEK